MVYGKILLNAIARDEGEMNLLSIDSRAFNLRMELQRDLPVNPVSKALGR